MSLLSYAASAEKGFSLLELLLILSTLAVLAGFSLVNAGEYRHRLQVDVAARRLQLGLECARLFALSQRQPCGLPVSAEGWQKLLVSELPACVSSQLSLQEPFAELPLTWQSNLPQLMRFAANGLTLDGGTVLFWAAFTALIDAVW